MKRLISIFRRHPYLGTGFALTLALTLFFAARTILFVAYWADPAHRDQEIRGWMTPGYVAHSWDVPRDTLRIAAGVPETPEKRRQTLDQIASDRGIPLDALIRSLEQAIAAERAAK